MSAELNTISTTLLTVAPPRVLARACPAGPRAIGRLLVIASAISCSEASDDVAESLDASAPDASAPVSPLECPDAATRETIEYMGRQIPVTLTRRGCPLTIEYDIP